MKLIHYTEVEPKIYDTETSKKILGRVLIGKADGAHNFCMRIFEMPPGGASALHEHHHEHEVFVHSGNGEVLIEGQTFKFKQGDALFIPGNKRHQVRNTGRDQLIFVCIIPSGVPEL